MVTDDIDCTLIFLLFSDKFLDSACDILRRNCMRRLVGFSFLANFYSNFCQVVIVIFFFITFISESVTIKDMKRISERLLESKPALAAYGDLSKLPSFQDVEKALVNDGKLPSASRFFLFR